MKVRNHPLGLIFENDQIIILFGNRQSTANAISEAFPDYKINRIKQTHGDRMINSSESPAENLAEADAHWTQDQKTALLISTADCVPAFGFDPVTQRVFGIHAGWRGVENRIIPKSLQKIRELGAVPSAIQMYIGPHIQRSSFEVEASIAHQLLRTLKSFREYGPSDREAIGLMEKLIFATTPEKFQVDLHLLVHAQMIESGILPENIRSIQVDTRTNLDFHSHRRDREKSGRQQSFIALK